MHYKGFFILTLMVVLAITFAKKEKPKTIGCNLSGVGAFLPAAALLGALLLSDPVSAVKNFFGGLFKGRLFSREVDDQLEDHLKVPFHF